MKEAADPADARKPWERKADRIFRVAAVVVVFAFLLAASLLGPEGINTPLWFGILLGLLAIGAFAILSFPTSTGPMERPATPWPSLMKVIGLLLTGVALGILWTSGMSYSALPAAALFGPVFFGIGAFESWRRARVHPLEVPA